MKTEKQLLDEYTKLNAADWKIHDQQNSLMVRLYNQGYHAGHEDTVEGCFSPIHHTDMDTYHADVVAAIIREND